MFKILSVVFLSLVLTGCYQTVNIYDINKAVIVCKGLENVQEIYAYMLGDERVVCKNGKEKSITNVIEE